VNSCVNSPEDGPVGPKHVEIRRYMNKIEKSDISWFFISYAEKMHGTKSLKSTPESAKWPPHGRFALANDTVKG